MVDELRFIVRYDLCSQLHRRGVAKALGWLAADCQSSLCEEQRVGSVSGRRL